MVKVKASRPDYNNNVAPVNGMIPTGLPTVMSAFLIMGLMAAVLPGLTWAEEDIKDPAPEKLIIRGGLGYIFSADTTLRVDGPIVGIGSTIDFNDTLGGNRDYASYRTDALFRFNPRHSLGFTWYNVKRSGNKTISRSFTIDDVTFFGGASVNSNLDFDMYRILYNYSFYRSEKVELAVSPGLYLADIEFGISGTLTAAVNSQAVTFTSATVKEDITAPLPSLGGLVNYHITPNLLVQVRADWFWIEVGGFKGSMAEMYVGLEYRLFKYLAIGAAYDRLSIDLQIDSGDDGGSIKVDNDWNIAYLYGTLYLF